MINFRIHYVIILEGNVKCKSTFFQLYFSRNLGKPRQYVNFETLRIIVSVHEQGRQQSVSAHLSTSYTAPGHPGERCVRGRVVICKNSLQRTEASLISAFPILAWKAMEDVFFTAEGKRQMIFKFKSFRSSPVREPKNLNRLIPLTICSLHIWF